MYTPPRALFVSLTLGCCLVAKAAHSPTHESTSTSHKQATGNTEWPNYGNDPGGMRYSALTEINGDNVSKLQVAWVRAFDVETGKELWNAPLPASGHATPMTFQAGAMGKQYLVVAAGGHPKITEESLGDALVAFTLP